MEQEVLGKVAVEMIEIFKYMDIGILYRIPEKLRKKLAKIRDKNYQFHYDKTKPLKDQAILPETRAFFSGLYIEFCCDQHEKKELIKRCKANDNKN